MAQLATVALLLGGEKIFSLVGLGTPSWYHVVAENKMMTFGVVWMANNFANQLIATGAFEIEVDGVPVYSKLDTGRLPTVKDIVDGFHAVGLDMPDDLPAAPSAADDDHEF
mmetsp:Transcript_9261/g.23573  ORF Transcript_9261/g.23573 Transcript_9261/m.23573 type:complete len:111 (-) Transcript_9261:173-505(-)